MNSISILEIGPPAVVQVADCLLCERQRTMWNRHQRTRHEFAADTGAHRLILDFAVCDACARKFRKQYGNERGVAELGLAIAEKFRAISAHYTSKLAPASPRA